MSKLKAFPILAILSIGAVIAVGFYGFIAGRVDANSSSQMASVNGEPISIGEFKLFVEKNRANVYSYFNQKYGATDSKDFWTTAINKEIPLNILKQKAMDAITLVKVQQLLAKQQGIIQDTSYSAFLKELKQENNRRKQALATNKVIYGPQKYDEQGYYTYLFSGMVTRLKESLAQGKLAASDDQLKSYYEANKEKLYKIQDMISIQMASISYSGTDSTELADSKAQLKNLMDLVKTRVDQGESLVEIAKQLRRENQVNLELQDIKLDESSYRNQANLTPNLIENVSNLAEGETSQVYEEDNAFHILNCSKRTQSGYRAFEEIKGNIKSILVDKSYEDQIDKLLITAKVEINRAEYNDFSI